ncbi:peptidase S8/S53 domain-containing protein [Pelagophyceae sp. CCMP2097]|nr:peptidase S8/S53 domain-containing protein [Pelagophyceae sp. CCMP2097]
MEEVRQLDQIGARDGDAKSLYKRIVAPGMEALPLHARGFTGAGANVAVFDTGLRLGHEHFPKPPVERARRRHLLESEARGINWTSEPSRADTMGHGTFVASLVGGEFAVCPGFAPGAKLHVHKVFTNYQVSFTSWFLDAFNYIMLRGDIDVINLSVGGPDFADAPFVEKVRQVVASGIAVVSAMGNDGPLWGTLNSPGDMPETIGVGGSEADSGAVAKFSSRGATLFERSHGGSGLFKPDVTAPAAGVLGSLVDGTGCRAMHGTSVASPSVAGLATLVAAAYRDAMKQRGLPHKRNPAMIKQCVTGTANRYRPRADLQNAHDAASVLAQGAGRVNASAAVACAMAYPARGRVSVAPAALHLDDCPYFWPWCAQPLYGGARPITLNLTLTNGADVLSYLKRAAFIPSDAHSRQWLRVAVDDDLVKQRTKLWPWGGSVGMSVAVDKAAYDFEGRLSGVLRLWVGGPRARNACGADDDGEDGELHLVDVPVRVGVVKRPPREKRLLWDMGHSIAYPPAYIPRDTLGVDADLLDWNGDEPTTNFQNAFRKLRAAGYYVDVLRGGYECFDAAEYGALLVVDSEDEFAAAEIGKISKDVRDKGLGLFVVADWHDPKLVEEVHFFDENTQVEWFAAVGGANVPALNRLLAPLGLGLGSDVFEGDLPAALSGLPKTKPTKFASGNAVVTHKARVFDAYPAGTYVVTAALTKRTSTKRARTRAAPPADGPQPVVFAAAAASRGRVAVFGDSSCLDDALHVGPYCWPALLAGVKFVTGGGVDADVFGEASQTAVAGAVAGGDASALLRTFSRRFAGGNGPPYKPEDQIHAVTCDTGA